MRNIDVKQDYSIVAGNSCALGWVGGWVGEGPEETWTWQLASPAGPLDDHICQIRLPAPSPHTHKVTVHLYRRTQAGIGLAYFQAGGFTEQN